VARDAVIKGLCEPLDDREHRRLIVDGQQDWTAVGHG
jgi:hypothetical protein